ncbi:MAG: hypothetical protein QOE08_667, partial [Thermoleophilaceae bacterium]|nr:hypothetical protein [Thermoleophilaceae bacterium]
PELLAEGWPVAGARVERFGEIPAPGLELPTTGGFEGWLQSKSKNFRQQIRRGRRKLDKMGAEWRVSTEGDELSRDLESFARLHRARWSHKGGSGVLSGPIEQMLHDAAAELPGDRLRVYSIDVDGESISSQVFVGAGDELVYWNGGFDERFAAHHPALQTLVFAIEDAFTRGEGRVDLGAGAQDYKYRLASGEEKLEFARVVAPDALTRLRYAPERLRRSASGHLSDGQKTRIRALMRRSPA